MLLFIFYEYHISGQYASRNEQDYSVAAHKIDLSKDIKLQNISYIQISDIKNL